MSSKFDLVKSYLHEMELPIITEVPEEELVITSDPERGISNLVLDCEDPIIIIEQVILELPKELADPCTTYRRLLQMNRNLVHGAFVLNEEGTKILFRDTLQLENLDRNELEGSIQALGMALAEYSSELLGFVGK